MSLSEPIPELPAAPPAGLDTLALALFAAVGVAAVLGTLLFAVCVLAAKSQGGAR